MCLSDHNHSSQYELLQNIDAYRLLIIHTTLVKYESWYIAANLHSLYYMKIKNKAHNQDANKAFEVKLSSSSASQLHAL